MIGAAPSRHWRSRAAKSTMSNPPTRITTPRLTARAIASCCPSAMSARPTTQTQTLEPIAMAGLHAHSSPCALRSHKSGATAGSGARGRLDRFPRKETGHDNTGLIEQVEGNEDDHHIERIGRRRNHCRQDEKDQDRVLP